MVNGQASCRGILLSVLVLGGCTRVGPSELQIRPESEARIHAMARVAILSGNHPRVPGDPERRRERNWKALAREFSVRGTAVADYAVTRGMEEASGITGGKLDLTPADLEPFFSDLGVDGVVAPHYDVSVSVFPLLVGGRIRRSVHLTLPLFVPGEPDPVARVEVEGRRVEWAGPFVLAGGITAAAGAPDIGWPLAATGLLLDLFPSLLSESASFDKAFDKAIQAAVDQLASGMEALPTEPPAPTKPEVGAFRGMHAGLQGNEVKVTFRLGQGSLPDTMVCAAAMFSDRNEKPLSASGAFSRGGQVAALQAFPSAALSGSPVDLTLPVEALGLWGTSNLGRHELSATILLWEGNCRSVRPAQEPLLRSGPAGFCIRKLAIGYIPC